jgi:cell division septal protein FtsQ
MRKPSDDENSRDEVLARYERGVMTLLFILAAASAALIIWLGWVFLSWGELKSRVVSSRGGHPLNDQAITAASVQTGSNLVS